MLSYTFAACFKQRSTISKRSSFPNKKITAARMSLPFIMLENRKKKPLEKYFYMIVSLSTKSFLCRTYPNICRRNAYRYRNLYSFHEKNGHWSIAYRINKTSTYIWLNHLRRNLAMFPEQHLWAICSDAAKIGSGSRATPSVKCKRFYSLAWRSVCFRQPWATASISCLGSEFEVM